MRVSRSLHIPAPQGHAVHAVGQCYTDATGRRLVESVVHHAFDGHYYFTARAYRRFSDDNGRSWTAAGPVFSAHPEREESGECTPPRHFLDGSRNALLAVYSQWRIRTTEPQFASNTADRSYRIFYEISRDGARAWEPGRQVVHHGAGYDETHWLPGITHGRNGAYAESCAPVALDDGTIVFGIVIAPLDATGSLYRPYGGYWYEVAFLRGLWRRNGSALDWEVGGRIRVPPEVSSVGCCEPDLLHLGGSRLFSTMRCQGIADKGVYSSRRCCLSNDGGLTWTEPKPLAYEDGSPVWVPASYSAFLRSPRTGRAYWFANILDQPVYAQYPRYPLAVAEFDVERLCILRKTVQVVQGLPEGAPPCTSALPRTDEECGRQYTNFGHYVDRETGEFVLTMPEMPKVSWKDFTADCIQFRIAEQ